MSDSANQDSTGPSEANAPSVDTAIWVYNHADAQTSGRSESGSVTKLASSNSTELSSAQNKQSPASVRKSGTVLRPDHTKLSRANHANGKISTHRTEDEISPLLGNTSGNYNTTRQIKSLPKSATLPGIAQFCGKDSSFQVRACLVQSDGSSLHRI